MSATQTLSSCLKTLLLPVMRAEFENRAEQARASSLSYEEYLLGLAEIEIENRNSKRFQRRLKESGMPHAKTLSSFDMGRLPRGVFHQFTALLDGRFIERKENLLLFGTPGSGKTHLMCGLAQEMLRNDYRCLFRPCSALLQELLVAKKELKLNRLLKKLGGYDLILVDEIGYVQQEKEEMELLFTFLAECYEKTSVVLTSNLPFSKWEGVFKDPMMAAAAVDRLVHHSIILELNLPSYRMEKSKKRQEEELETLPS